MINQFFFRGIVFFDKCYKIVQWRYGMTAVNIICFAIYFLVALLMISIGVSQLKNQEPVGFYSGEKPPKKDELTDIISWNKKHGAM